MTFCFLDGMYPTHPFWFFNPLLIAFFEVVVILTEICVILSIHDWAKKTKKDPSIWLMVAIVISNIVTFTIGALLEQGVLAW
jgi:hypothetical protein